MNLVIKKISFALPWLLLYAFLLKLLAPLLIQGTDIIGLNGAIFIQMIWVAVMLLVSASVFAVFATIANDWWYVLGVAGVSLGLPLLWMPADVAWILAIGGFVGQVVAFGLLNLRLQSYLTFRTSEIVYPAAKNLVFVVMVAATLVFYLETNLDIQTRGFSVPDSLVEAAVNIALSANPTAVQNQSKLPISADQIAQLKANPELLKQYGVDPSILDTINSGTAVVQNDANIQLKQAVKSQFNQLAKPYTSVMPIVLAILFFFGLASLTALGTFIPLILLWAIFAILKATGFIHFGKEMREVQKMVV